MEQTTLNKGGRPRSHGDQTERRNRAMSIIRTCKELDGSYDPATVRRIILDHIVSEKTRDKSKDYVMALYLFEIRMERP